MNLKEKAREFAFRAHYGQIRKSQPDTPYIFHPLVAGSILEEYGCSDDVVIAGYLHDVIEDTKYSKEDIEELFGSKITSYVLNASEEDKSLSWEVRKQQAIDIVKELPLENKLVFCADKISNLEDLRIKFAKENKRDFSSFKRGEESQKWYYLEMYKGLIHNEDENNPIFKRLKQNIDYLFLMDGCTDPLTKIDAKKFELEKFANIINSKDIKIKKEIIDNIKEFSLNDESTLENSIDILRKIYLEALKQEYIEE